MTASTVEAWRSSRQTKSLKKVFGYGVSSGVQAINWLNHGGWRLKMARWLHASEGEPPTATKVLFPILAITRRLNKEDELQKI